MQWICDQERIDLATIYPQEFVNQRNSSLVARVSFAEVRSQLKIGLVISAKSLYIDDVNIYSDSGPYSENREAGVIPGQPRYCDLDSTKVV